MTFSCGIIYKSTVFDNIFSTDPCKLTVTYHMTFKHVKMPEKKIELNYLLRCNDFNEKKSTNINSSISCIERKPKSYIG